MKISNCVDNIILEAVFASSPVVKSAGLSELTSDLSKFTNGLKNYVSQHIDENNKVASFLSFMTPGILITALSAVGVPWYLVAALSGAATIFGVDLTAMFASIINKLSGLLKSKGSVTESEISQAVDQSAGGKTASYNLSEKLFAVRQIKLAALSDSPVIIKNAAAIGILLTVLKWFFKAALLSAGLMVAVDIGKKMLGKPNAIDGTLKSDTKSSFVSSPQQTVSSTQSKFKVKPSYSNKQFNVNSEWIEYRENTSGSIDNMLVDFANEVYDGLDGLDSLIRSATTFRLISSRIAAYNSSSQGDNLVFIPRFLHTKKNIVDIFIDEVALKAPESSQ